MTIDINDPERKRILKREIMRDMINVMIASIYNDGSKPFFPIIKFKKSSGVFFNREIETDKCKYYLFTKGSWSDKKEEIIFDDKNKVHNLVYYTNDNQTNLYEVFHKGLNIGIKPIPNSDLENRMINMFKEVFTNV